MADLQTTLAETSSSRSEPATPATKQYGTQKSNGGGRGDPTCCCVICLESLADPCVAQPCAHAHFDFVCLASWLQRHPTCPLCKARVTSVRYGLEHDRERGNVVVKYSVYTVPAHGEAATHSATHSTAAGPGRPSDPTNARRRDTGPWSRRQPPPPPPSAGEAIMRRRRVYRQQLYSLHVGSNPYSRHRDPTPAQLATTPHLMARARTWIRRELGVFEFLRDDGGDDDGKGDARRRRRRRADNAEFLLEYIVAVIKTVDMQGSSGAAEAMLADFLGRSHARLFLHELRSWLRSPHATLEAWDREVQYPAPSPAVEASPRREWEREREREGAASGRRRELQRSEDDGVGQRTDSSRLRGDRWRPDLDGKRR